MTDKDKGKNTDTVRGKSGRSGGKKQRIASAAVVVMSVIAALWSLVQIVTVTVMIIKEPASLSGLAGQFMLLLSFFGFILPACVFLFLALLLNLLLSHTYGKSWSIAALISFCLLPLGWMLISMHCFDGEIAAAAAVAAGAALTNIMTVFTVFELERKIKDRRSEKKKK